MSLVVERYTHTSSAVHKLDARTKLVATLLFVLVATLLPWGAWLPYALLWLATLFVAQRAGLGTFFALRRSFVALPFALAAITLPFTVPGHLLGSVGPLTLSVEGTVRFASIVVKSWVSVQAAILLTATTTAPDLIEALRALRVPSLLISIIGFMYRYLFVLGDEATRLLRARAGRAATITGCRSGGSLPWRARVAGGMIGSLSLRAFERSERIHAAMLARGFTGELKTLAQPTFGDADAMALVWSVTFLAMVLLIGLVFA